MELLSCPVDAFPEAHRPSTRISVRPHGGKRFRAGSQGFYASLLFCSRFSSNEAPFCVLSATLIFSRKMHNEPAARSP